VCLAIVKSPRVRTSEMFAGTASPFPSQSLNADACTIGMRLSDEQAQNKWAPESWPPDHVLGLPNRYPILISGQVRRIKKRVSFLESLTYAAAANDSLKDLGTFSCKHDSGSKCPIPLA
jgi:hypothetical protein